MSPTKLEVRRAEIDRLQKLALRSGDLAQLQSLLAEEGALLRSVYGSPVNA